MKKQLKTKSFRLLMLWLFAFAIFMSVSIVAHAGAPNPNAQTVKQPNGDVIKIRQYGDEFVNWMATVDTGDVVIKDKDGYWKYGKIVGNEIKSSTQKFDPDTAKKSSKPFNTSLKMNDAVTFAKKEGPRRESIASKGAASYSESASPSAPAAAPGVTGTSKLLVILVDFNDVKIKNTEEAWNNLMFNPTGGSVKHYYNEVSQGRFQWAPAEETYGAGNNGIIRVSLNYNHPNPASTGSANQLITKNALIAADPFINYKSFDANGDGYIQNTEMTILLIAAGYEQTTSSLTPRVWAHKFELFGDTLTSLDDVYVAGGKAGTGYAQVGEMHTATKMATFGVIAHELAHMLGLPDLYDRTGKSMGIGYHSLMAFGNWTGPNWGDSPAHMDPFSKIKLGFVDPILIDSSVNKEFTLFSIGTGKYNIIKVPTNIAAQYYLIENRQFELYDKHLYPGVDRSGIAIWQINEWESSNDNPANKMVDLEEANEGVIGFSELDQYRSYNPSRPYYSVGNVTEYNFNTTPSSKNPYNVDSGLKVSVKSTPGQAMTVQINYTLSDYSAPTVPTGLTVEANGSTGAILNWQPSTDNVVVKGYNIYQDGVKIGTSTSTNYSISNLQSGREYSFTVDAFDSVGKTSAQSSAVKLTTGGKQLTVYFKKKFNGNHYLIYRTFISSWNDAPGKLMLDSDVEGYVKTTVELGSMSDIEAYFGDGNGNVDNGGGSNYLISYGTGTATVENGKVKYGKPSSSGTTSDTTAPSQPNGLTASAITDRTLTLTWNASSDDTAVTSYEVYRDQVKVASTTETNYNETYLTPNTTYSYQVKALDNAGNGSELSPAIQAKTLSSNANSVSVYYKRKTADGVQYMHYRPIGGSWSNAPGVIMQDSEAAGYAKLTVFIGSANGIEACFNVNNSNWDSNGGRNYLINEGIYTVENGVIKAGAPIANTTDTTPPSIPGNLQSTGRTETSISLSWNASTDDKAVTGYDVFRNGSKVGSSTSTSYTDNGLTAGTSYEYTVKAYDAAGNYSTSSNSISVTTNTVVTTQNSITVYYKRTSTTGTQFMHYRPVGGQWSNSPGVAMTNSEVPGYAKITVTIGAATTIEACFNVDGNNWDSKGGSNYMIPTGIQTVENSTVKTGAPNPPNVDSTAPSVPTGLQMTSTSETSVALKWTASTDNVAVSGYEVYRNGSKVGTTATTTYTDGGLTASTTYNYTVKAYDAAGNLSNASSSLSATTKTAVVTQNSVTVYYKRSGSTGTQYMHFRPTGGQWSSAPGVAMSASEVAGYAKITVTIGSATTIEACFNVDGNNWDSKGGSNYSIPMGIQTVENSSVKAGAPTGTVGDTAAPNTPTNLVLTSKNQNSISISWTASTDNVGVTGYEVYRNSSKVGTATTTNYTDSNLTAGTSYTYTIKAFDAAGNYSTSSISLSASTDPIAPPSDTTAPSVPSNVKASNKTETTVSLTWDASTDNVGVTGYEIYRYDNKIATSNTNSYTDTGLTAGTTYTYTVKALDAAGNVSNASTSLAVTTNMVVVSDNSLTIYYKRTINTGTQYIHYRPVAGNWTNAPGVAMSAAEIPGYAKITLKIGSATAIDAAFNVNNGNWDSKGGSNYSIPMGTHTVENSSVKAGAPTGTTTDTESPTIPSNLQSTAKTQTSVSLSWTASSDNVGVTGYEIYRNGNKVGTASGTTYTDSGLISATTYSYTVKAYDAANNFSAGSNSISVTTNAATLTQNSVTVYYKRTVATGTQNIHYRPTGGSWTNAPGVAMTNDQNGYAKFTINLGSATSAEVCFNVSNTNWDSNGGKNYIIGMGDVTIEAGAIKNSKPY